MNRPSRGRWSSILALVIALVALGVPLAVTREPAPARRTVPAEMGYRSRSSAVTLAAGVLLVARRDLTDPNFAETVVLIVAYAKQSGATGLVVNRRTNDRVWQVLPSLTAAGARESFLFSGGPVGRDQVRALVRAPQAGIGLRVLPDVTLVTTADAIQDIAGDTSADELHVYLGYSGWGPAQLEREVERGDWHVIQGDGKVIFAPEPAGVWRRQIRLVDSFTMTV